MLYLTNDQKQMAMSLYREAFPEDSDSFIDYYQSEVLSRNEVLAEIAGDQVISMIHQNPYRIKMCDKNYNINYLVAVATAKEYRRQGYMRDLMERTLQDLYEKGQPFCYLQPANPAYYEPFDFAFVSNYEKNEYRDGNSCLILKVSPSELMTNIQLKDWIRAYLNQFEVANARDDAYFDRLSKELASENGYLQIIYKDNGSYIFNKDKESISNHTDTIDKEASEIVGIIAWWGLLSREVRFSYILPEFAKKCNTKKPYMMARLLDVAKAVEQVKLVDAINKPTLTVGVDLHDEILEQNNGWFVWEITKIGSSWKNANGIDVLNVPIIDISISLSSAEFIQYLFGYSIPSGFEEFAHLIKVYNKVLLDEVV